MSNRHDTDASLALRRLIADAMATAGTGTTTTRGEFSPTPAMIDAACDAIQETWSDSVRRKRLDGVDDDDDRVECQLVNLSMLR